MFGNAPLTPPTMLASERCSDHAGSAEIRLIELPVLQQFIDNSSLFGNSFELGYISRIVAHGRNVEKRRKEEQGCKDEVKQKMRVGRKSRIGSHSHDPVDANQK